MTGSGRHRDAAEAALRHVRTLAERAPRFAGWSLAAAEAALAGPLEVAVVGAPGDPARDALARVARRASAPGLVVVVADGAVRGDVPLLRPTTPEAGRPAAYACRRTWCATATGAVGSRSCRGCWSVRPSGRRRLGPGRTP